jgi:hypothetical protein
VSELNEGCDVDLVSSNSFLECERLKPSVDLLFRQDVSIHSHQHTPQKFTSLLKNAPHKVVKEFPISDLLAAIGSRQKLHDCRIDLRPGPENRGAEFFEDRHVAL